MPSNSANPLRVQQIATRLQRHYEGTPALVTMTALPRRGCLILITHREREGASLTMRADDVDNGASGFRTEALERINAFLEGQPYVPEAPQSGRLDYSDVITYGGRS